MSAEHLTFADAIRDAARAAGRAPTPEQVADLDGIVRSLATIGEDNTLSIELDGRTIDFDTFLGRELGAMPRAPEPDATATTTPDGPRISGDGQHILLEHPGGARWVQRGALADMILGFSQEDHAAQAREAAGWANPWATEHFNRTRQVLLSKIDPARAAILKSQAGKKP